MKRRCAGFTLLEMVVAIGIFAVIAAISYDSLNNFLDARAQIDERRGNIQKLQTAMTLMEMDFRYAVDRGVRDQFGDTEAAFVAGGVLAAGELVRLTTAQPAAGTGGNHQVKRVAWRLDDRGLSRVTWRVLEREIDSPEYERLLLESVEGIDFTYFSFNQGDELETSEEWLEGTGLPAGLEVRLGVTGYGEFRRVFQVAGSEATQ
jgi:general secretion pathway protein J